MIFLVLVYSYVFHACVFVSERSDPNRQKVNSFLQPELGSACPEFFRGLMKLTDTKPTFNTHARALVPRSLANETRVKSVHCGRFKSLPMLVTMIEETTPTSRR